MKLLIHWQDFPGYAAACVAELRRRHPVETLVVYDRFNRNAPYERETYQGVGMLRDITGLDANALHQIVAAFQPSAALVGGWTRYALDLARGARKLGVPIIACSDNMYYGTLRQRIFPFYRRLRLSRLHDYYWVPGQKAKDFLVSSGVKPSRIWTGLYAPDVARFQPVACAMEAAQATGRPAFLFVGQYIHRKGLPELLDAFQSAATDWRLILCGVGPLKPLVSSLATRSNRVEDRGFVQPQMLPQIMSEASVFVLPSRRDNWPLVIGEAAAAGLPILCSDACGSALELVREGENGFVFKSRDVETLRQALEKMARLDSERLATMGRTSAKIAEQFTPSRWADYLFSQLTCLASHGE